MLGSKVKSYSLAGGPTGSKLEEPLLLAEGGKDGEHAGAKGGVAEKKL